MDRILLKLLAIVCVLSLVKGHGYLLTPPQRNTAWRAGFNTPTDSNDMANYCGGRGTQHGKNGGKCGVCGEEYSNPNKRLEPGPANKYATGMIFAEYEQGQTIDVTVVLTAFHKGYFEFRLCENDVPQKGKDASIAVTQDCLNRHLLKSPSGETKIPAVTGKATYKVVLDSDVYCTNCVFQWRYRTGNNWGCDSGNVCGSGKGPQEEFWGCSDIAIKPWSDEKDTPPPTTTMKTAPPTTTMKTEAPTTTMKTEQPTTTMKTDAPTKQPTKEQTTMEEETTTQAVTELKTEEPSTQEATTMKPTTMKPTTMKLTTPQPTTRRPTTQRPKTQPPRTRPAPTKAQQKPKPQRNGRKRCRGFGPTPWMFDTYCDQNCNHYPPYCPPSHCRCE